MEDIQSQSIEQEASKGKGRGKLPAAKVESKGLKVNLQLGEEHPVAKFCEEVRSRGIKGFNSSDFLLEVLAQVPESFFTEKLEQLTPLEYRINAALADPDMREKLQQLLTPGPNLQ